MKVAKLRVPPNVEATDWSVQLAEDQAEANSAGEPLISRMQCINLAFRSFAFTFGRGFDYATLVNGFASNSSRPFSVFVLKRA